MSFYGSFLIRLGVVTTEQVDAALVVQNQGRLRLGELAVQAGLLTTEQVDLIQRCQLSAAEGDLRFGELAVALGFSDTEAMDQLQRKQRQGWRKLGEILVEMGALDRGTHESYLRDFLHLELVRRREIEASISEAPHPRILEAMVELTRRWLPRFGLSEVRVIDVRLAPRAVAGVTWSARRDLHGTIDVIVVLGLSTRGLLAISGQTMRPDREDRPDLALPALAETLETLTELMMNRLPELNLKADAVSTFADEGCRSVEDLMAERSFAQIELSHIAQLGNPANVVLTLVSRPAR